MSKEKSVKKIITRYTKLKYLSIYSEMDWFFIAKWEYFYPFGNSCCAQRSHHILYYKTFVTIVFFIDKHIPGYDGISRINFLCYIYL